MRALHFVAACAFVLLGAALALGAVFAPPAGSMAVTLLAGPGASFVMGAFLLFLGAAGLSRAIVPA